MRVRTILSILMLFSQGFTEGPRDISARDLISLPSIRSLELHEGQEIIVFGQREADLSTNRLRQHIWKINTDGSGKRQLTFSSGDEWAPSISPTGTCLAFMSDRPDADGEEGSRIWAMALTGGEAKPLTDSERSILDFQWSADGNLIYYLTPEVKPAPSTDWIQDRESEGFDGIDRTLRKPRIELWQVDKTTSQHNRLFVGDPGVYGFDISPDSELMVYVTNYTGDVNDWVETDLYLFSIRDSLAVKQLTGFKGSEDDPQFSPDGRYVAYSTAQDPNKPFSQTEVHAISIEKNNVSRLTSSLDLNVSNFRWYTDQTLLLEVQEGMNNHLYAASLKGRSTALSGGAAYFFRSASAAGTTSMAAVRQTAKTLSEIVYSRGPGHPWITLTNNSAKLTDLTINPQTNFRWKSRDDRFLLEGLVVLPHFSGHDPLPLIVHVHGGPASRTDIALEQGELLQAWASQGFAVFSPNYRGSEGYSAAFQSANYRDLGGGDFQDIRMGVKELIRRGIAHPDSLVIMGGSYGGYMANWAITQTNMFKVAVSKYGIWDLQSDFSNSIYAQWEVDYLGKTYWKDPTAYRLRSPSSYAEKIQTPTLILHGADDENTFTSNSRELARALKTLDVPHRFILYPREGHGMYEPSHQIDVFEKSLSWINEHLQRSTPLKGSDWLSGGIQVQILEVDHEAEFLNTPGEKFLTLKLLIDGSTLERAQRVTLDDISLSPGGEVVLGFSSGRMLAPSKYFSLDVGPDLRAVELDLVFVQSGEPHQALKINGIGSFDISN